MKPLTEKQRTKLEKDLAEARQKLHEAYQEREKIFQTRWRRTANDKSKNAIVSYKTQLQKKEIADKKCAYYSDKETEIVKRLWKDDEARKQAGKLNRCKHNDWNPAHYSSKASKKRK